jgi:hypothetical protein
MAIALSIFGVAFAAFCVWLTVRIVNRQRRWAKWTLAVVVGVPALYVVSFGPACWLSDRKMIQRSVPSRLYNPLASYLAYGESERIRGLMIAYGEWGGGYLEPPMQPTAKVIIYVARGEFRQTHGWK